MLPGITLPATAVSWARSMALPVTRTMLGAGWPAGPGRVSSGMTTKVPPPGWAGVLLRMPATRTLTGPIGYSEVSCVAPRAEEGRGGGRGEHRHRGAGGQYSAAPRPGADLAPAGNAGNGVPATTAA